MYIYIYLCRVNPNHPPPLLYDNPQPLSLSSDDLCRPGDDALRLETMDNIPPLYPDNPRPLFLSDDQGKPSGLGLQG